MIRALAADHPHVAELQQAYFDELRVRLGAFEDPTDALLRADAASGIVLVAYDGDAPIACGTLRRFDTTTGEVKRMFVIAAARRRGVARTMLRALEDRARALGFARIVLDTAAPLEEAQRMYQSDGYRAIARYNDNTVAACWFEKTL